MNLSWLRKARSFAVYAAAVSVITVAAGCGGGGSYDAPEAVSTTPTWWADYDQSAQSLVSADDVAEWIRNGYVTEDGNPVVILDVQTAFTDATKNRIIGSTAMADIESYTISEKRAEGPINTIAKGDTSATMVPKGATMDAIVQDLGLDQDTVLVLTSASSGNGVWNLTRGWWMMYYWGFSEANVKILNGGVAAMAVAAPDLVNTTAESVDPVDSTFSVKDLPCTRPEARVSTKQVIDAVKNNSAKIIDARSSSGTSGAAVAGVIKNAIIAPTAGFGGSNLVNADGTFKTKEEMQAAFDAAGIKSTDTIIVHCYSGYSATPIYFFLKEVMEYENVALYDGSWSAWAVHTGFSPLNAAYTSLSTTVSWNGTQFVDANGVALTSADIALGGTLQTDENPDLMAFDTLRYSGSVLLKATTAFEDIYGNSIFDLNASYSGNGNEINEEDAAYVASDDVVDSDDSEDEQESTGTPATSGC